MYLLHNFQQVNGKKGVLEFLVVVSLVGVTNQLIQRLIAPDVSAVFSCGHVVITASCPRQTSFAVMHQLRQPCHLRGQKR